MKARADPLEWNDASCSAAANHAACLGAPLPRRGQREQFRSPAVGAMGSHGAAQGGPGRPRAWPWDGWVVATKAPADGRTGERNMDGKREGDGNGRNVQVLAAAGGCAGSLLEVGWLHRPSDSLVLPLAQAAGQGGGETTGEGEGSMGMMAGV